MLYSVSEPNGLADMAYPILRRSVIGPSDLTGHIGYHRNFLIPHRDTGDELSELLKHRFHQRRMKRMRDR